MDVEHNIFKDLTSAYVDGLTSQETKETMEKHMAECEECRQYLHDMQMEMQRENEEAKNSEKQSIDYFKKVRKNGRKRILLATSIVSLAFLSVAVVYYFLYIDMRLANVDHISMNVQNEDGTVTIMLTPKKDNRYLLVDKNWSEGYVNSLFVYEMRDDHSASANVLKDGMKISYTFIDEQTILLDNGKRQAVTKNDVLSIHFKNSTKEIALQDLYQMGK